MNREVLISKWLNHELNADELEAFKKLEEYVALSKLNDGIKGFKASNYNASEELQTVLTRIKPIKSNKKSWFPTAASIAAILVFCFGFYYFTTTLDSNFNTLASQKEVIELPDGSTAQLNALSELSFNKHKWQDKRELELNGEAYFKVAKGSKFKVKTQVGTVTVLGTKFNIKQRQDFFEVVCYEGLVNVIYKSHTVNLSPGNSFLIRDEKLIVTENGTQPSPSWIDNYSRFKSVPYKDVISEFERQYDLKVNLNSVDDTQVFTGSFTHDNMETALKSITLPLQLTYSKKNRTIILKRE